MLEFRSVDIDIDVHKRIELERRSFNESDNEVLRRLLGVDEHASPGLPASHPKLDGRAWSGKGVTLTHGTQLRMSYNGRRHFGDIDDGEWLVEGNRYRSPSGAAVGVARTRAGRLVSLDGWEYWEAKPPGEDKWTLIMQLRRQAGSI